MKYRLKYRHDFMVQQDSYQTIQFLEIRGVHLVYMPVGKITECAGKSKFSIPGIRTLSTHVRLQAH